MLAPADELTLGCRGPGAGRLPRERRDELRWRLNDIRGVAVPVAKLALRPSFKLAALQEDRAFDQFISALGWFVEQCDGPPPRQTYQDAGDER